MNSTARPSSPAGAGRNLRRPLRVGLVGWREVHVSLIWLVRHVAGASLQPLRERKLYLRGKQAAEIEPLADEFCQDILCPGLAADGLARMDEHRRAGHQIVLVTGSLDFLVAPLARWLGIERVLAARPERLNGRYTGEVVTPLPYGDGKRLLITELALHDGLDLAACYAYGDSPGDVEILEGVEEHERIVIEGTQNIRDGSAVHDLSAPPSGS